MTAPCDSPAPETGAFVRGDDGNWTFRGALTFDNAAAVMEQCAALPLPVGGRIDVSGLTAADSSALAVLLALRRRGSADRRKVHVAGLPESLASLARVYGLAELLES